MSRPTLYDSVAGHRARQLADWADTIAARADEMAARVTTSLWQERTYQNQARYAEGVRDALRWLAGDRPADMLTDVLDIEPEGKPLEIPTKEF